MKNSVQYVIKHTFSQLRTYFLGLTKKGSHQIWMTFFVVGTSGVLIYLVYLASLVAPELEAVNRHFSHLSESASSGGIELFLRRKNELRSEVKRTLRVNKSKQAQMLATNISLYLFPDLLPNENFEKDYAIEAWVPLQKSIESNPGTHQSRIRFEALRATIWNYENPDRSSPKISEAARTVIEIYDAISRR